MRKIIFVLIGFAGLLLTGCGGPRMASDITVFHALPQQEQGKTYAFDPLLRQKNSLEYRAYAGYLQKELANHGYVLTSAPKASMLVRFAYMIDDGKTMSGSVPVWGKTGISSATTYGTGTSYGQLNAYGNYGSYSGTSSYSATTTYTPTYGVKGYRNVSYVTYTRRLKVALIDKKTKKSIYDAEVQSRGRSGQLSAVMPYMIRSLFKDFPGQSGSSKRIYMEVK